MSVFFINNVPFPEEEMHELICNRNLSLKNNGDLEVVFLGTGTPFTNKLYNNNFFIIKGDTHVLVDFGLTGPIALQEIAGLNPIEIDAILPTHSHSDHIGGIEYLALYKRYIGTSQGKGKLSMIITDEYRDILWSQSLRGGMEWNESNTTDRRLNFSDYFEQITPMQISNGNRKIYKTNYAGLDIEIFQTNHIPDTVEDITEAYISYGVFVDNRVFISCDTKFDLDLINIYKDRAEVLFHDCSFYPNPVHTSIDQLRTLPKDLLKKIYLMHYSDDWEKHDISDFGGLLKQGMRYII